MTSAMIHLRTRPRHAFTLVELLVVLVVLLALAGLVSAVVTTASVSARHDVTVASMARVRQAMATYSLDMQKPPAFIADLLRNPGTYAPYDPQTRKGWNGPYLQHSGAFYKPDASGLPVEHVTNFTTAYGALDSPCVLDGWGNPLVIQLGTWDGTLTGISKDSGLRIISAGEDGILQTPMAATLPALPTGRIRMPTRADRGDPRPTNSTEALPRETDLVLFYDQIDEATGP